MPKASRHTSEARTSKHGSTSDDAIAQEFAKRYTGTFVILKGTSQWCRWNGQQWASVSRDVVVEEIRRLCRELVHGEIDARKAEKLLSTAKFRAIEQLVQLDPKLCTSIDCFDRDPWLLNTPGCVVNLHDGSKSPHVPELKLRKSTIHSPDGDCPKWLGFLDRVTGGDTDLQSYLQCVAGYCLTSSVREQAIFILLGHGANGKSVFANVLIGLMNDYAIAAPPHLFTASRQERHPTELAALAGVRLVVVSELEQSTTLASSRLKFLTGGDKVSGRLMGKDFFEFEPTWKFLMTANQLPRFGKLDPAMRRRIIIIPFDVTFSPSEQDPDLMDKLMKEGDGILNWAVQGAVDWQVNGLCPPARVIEETRHQLERLDHVSRFISEKCICGDELSVRSSSLYKAFENWCREEGERPLSNQKFFADLDSKGFYRKDTSAERLIRRLDLKQDSNPPQVDQ